VEERNQVIPKDDVTVATKREATCYFIEIRLAWPYVMGLQPYTPKASDMHGFTIAANDWDVPLPSEAGVQPVRESQLFWVIPGIDYDYQTTGFGTLTLGP